ncbi:MAG: hypothetical protein JKX98_06260 [Alcanivoracaceae bacterium]|nr:hypothetical protein [Alcanivoracaceae bacterium]
MNKIIIILLLMINLLAMAGEGEGTAGTPSSTSTSSSENGFQLVCTSVTSETNQEDPDVLCVVVEIPTEN